MSAKKMRRKRRKNEKLQRINARVQRAWTPFARHVSRAPIPAAVKRALAKNKLRILKYRLPRPEVRLDPSALRYSEAELVRADVQSVFDTVDFEDSGIPAADYVMACLSLAQCSYLSRMNGVAHQEWLTAAAALRQFIQAEGRALMGPLQIAAYFFTMYYARIDQRIWWWSVDRATQKGKYQLVLTLHASSVESRNVLVDGETRRVYRCGSWNPPRQWTWTSWDTEKAGLGGEPATCDVYVQGHAFDRLRERIPIGVDAALHEAMVQSLARPLFTKSTNGSCLVEFRLLGQRLGYFIATRVESIIVIRSYPTKHLRAQLMTETQAKRELRLMLRSFTIGRVLHLLAEVLRESARAKRGRLTRRRRGSVAATLFVVGLGIDAACPR